MSSTARRRLLALLGAAALGLSGCAATSLGPAQEVGVGTAEPDGGAPDVGPDTSGLTETARLAVLFDKREPLVDLKEFRDGATYDGIPSVQGPVVVDGVTAAKALSPTEQVLVLEAGGAARAYPVRVLVRHEIVNDVLGGVPVAATWCPLCNTGIAFDRRPTGAGDGRAEEFGVSGQLYRSAMVMFDRRTQSLWPQPLGLAVVGDLRGAELPVLPSALLSFAEARAAHPRLDVALGDESELAESRNPYEGYDVSGRPFLFDGKIDSRLPTFTRVVGVGTGAAAQAWSHEALRKRRATAGEDAGGPLVVLWAPGAVSPLETDDVREGRDVGQTGVFRPEVDGEPVTLRPAGRAEFTDRETGSRWSVAGVATAGPRAGARLTRVAHQDAFWFAWAAFQPETVLRVP